MESTILNKISGFLGISVAELQDKLKNPESNKPLEQEEAGQVLDELFSNKIQAIKTHSAGKAVRDAKAKAAREAIKKYGLEAKTTDLSTVFDLLASKADNSENDQQPTTQPTNIKDSVEYKQLFTAFNDQKTALEKVQAELTQEQTGRQKDKIWFQAKGKLKSALLAKNPILPTDEKVKARQIEMFLGQFQNDNFSIDEGGNLVLLDSDGKPKLDDKYNAITLDSHIDSRAWFEYAKVDQTKEVPGKSPKGGSNGNGNKWNFGQAETTIEGYEAKKAELKQAGNHEGVKALDKYFADS